MTIARVIEISASTPKGVDDAAPRGTAGISRTARNIEAARARRAGATAGDETVNE